MFLLFLVVCGVIALVVVKVIKPNQTAIQSAAQSAGLPTFSMPNATSVVQTVTNAVTKGAEKVVHTLGGRKLLADMPNTGQQRSDWT